MTTTCQQCIKNMYNFENPRVSPYAKCVECEKTLVCFHKLRKDLVDQQSILYDPESEDEIIMYFSGGVNYMDMTNHLFNYHMPMSCIEACNTCNDLVKDKPNDEDYLMYQLKPKLYVTKKQLRFIKKIYWLTIAKCISMNSSVKTSVEKVVVNSDLQRFIGEYL